MSFGGGSDAASQLRKQQQQEKQRILEGTKAINAVFGGGTYGTNPATTFAPGTQYYTVGGQPYQTTFGPYRGTGANRARQEYLGLPGGRRDAGPTLAASGDLYAGTTTTPGFTPDFYAQRARLYENYALPQLQEQYGQSNRSLVYGQANRGLLGSSIAQFQTQGLQRELGRQQRQVADVGLGLSQDLQSKVEQQRADLIRQLAASGDPSATTAQAIGAATRFSAPSPLPPIGNFFNNWSQIYLANQFAQQDPYARRQQNTGSVSSPFSGASGRVVGG